jgi:hypothetical protein
MNIYMTSSCQLIVLSSFSRCTLDVIYKDFANCALCLNPHIVSLFGIIKVLPKKKKKHGTTTTTHITSYIWNSEILFIYSNFVVSKMLVLTISPFFLDYVNWLSPGGFPLVGCCLFTCALESSICTQKQNKNYGLLSPHIFILSNFPNNVPNKPIFTSLWYFHSSVEYVSKFPMLFFSLFLPIVVF